MSYENHHEWLSLIEISGPFLAVPVLKEAFPQGLEELDGLKRKRLRQAYDEWQEAQEQEDLQLDELHAAWIDEVLSRGLELDELGKGDVLKRADWCAANVKVSLPEHGVWLVPDFAVVDDQHANKPLLLIQSYSQDVDLKATLKQDGWVATPADRMVQLCRSVGCRLGLVTNGERWMLVDAPVGAVTTFASWYARIWSQEPITLQAFVHLLGIRRFFLDESEQLPALFDKSLKYQDEVTDALGEQVQRAVEVLIQALDKADQDRNRELLYDVKEYELYEATLTVMMRLVFLLSAEERGLLLMGDECYEANYSLSTLRMQLRKESEEILERRWDAWSRLLAIFRAVFGGIEHETLRLPALGGSLFDPDRFPFLEGRTKGSNWHSDAAKPLPIDNRTVLLLLEAIQQYQGRTLSYRALDVEQIGYIYEGLLERTVKRADEVTLELEANKSSKTPWVRLAELESARLDRIERLVELLQERSGKEARVINDLSKPVDDTLADRLLTACQGDTELRDRIKPYVHLLRIDPWGYPLVYPAGSFIVTAGSDRRETGTHYTPKSLTEAIVTETLTPVAYVGPAEGVPRDQWMLKSPDELLDLKICDPAMGSGAFLVQACRWLSDRLVESWSQVEATGYKVSLGGEVLGTGVAQELLPQGSEARILVARRLIAERCLYGVDLNPLAVELAKLSIWLVTLAKGRPFGFLDHNLRCGNSLFGIHRLDQLTKLSMTPDDEGQQRLFGKNIEQAVHEAIDLRQRLREIPIRDIRDVETMANLDADAHRRLEVPESIADAFIGEVFASSGTGASLKNKLTSLSIQAEQAINGDEDALASIRGRSFAALSTGLSGDRLMRKPFHWPIEFPEVFSEQKNGFDGLIGNPPFIGGRRMRSALGDLFLNWLKCRWPHASLNSDFCVFFYLHAADLLRSGGDFGFLGTKTIGQGDSARSGLSYLCKNRNFHIHHAISSFDWPGSAAVVAALVVLHKGSWNGTKILDGNIVNFISEVLDNQSGWGESYALKNNSSRSFQGSVLVGLGFVLTPLEAQDLLRAREVNSEVVKPYLGGEDLNTHPKQLASRWAIDFRDYTLEECESKWPEALARIRELVKPKRDLTRRAAHRKYWWHHGDKRPALYKSIADKEEVFVIARVTKYVAIVGVPANQIFHDKVYVFDLPGWSSFSILQSSFHDSWVRRGSSTVGETLNYTPSDYFDTFPFLHIDGISLAEIGQRYHSIRKSIMHDRNLGLTDVYNLFHEQSIDNQDINELRSLHVEMDIAVANAYGWENLNLDHDFYETKNGIRFTISDEARREALQRLLVLNHQCYEKEVVEGLHEKAQPNKRKKTKNPKTKIEKIETPEQPGFDFGKVDE